MDAPGTPADTRPPMFRPFSLRSVEIPNRVVMSPMTMISAVDGTVNDFHLVHYGARAVGGTGLIGSEMAAISAAGRTTAGCAGLYEPAHAAAWRRVTDFVHADTDAKIMVQLGHSGRKGWGHNRAGPDGRPAKPDLPEVMAPSPIPYLPKGLPPREMTPADLDQMIADHVRAARLADEAGFDMIELHGAHGYMLHLFMSPISNRRTDGYGGSLEARMRFPLEVFAATREAWPDDKPIAFRYSALEWIDGGNSENDAIEIARMLADAGVDILTVSGGIIVPAAMAQGEGPWHAAISARIKREVGIPTMCVGNIRGAADINRMVEQGEADLCVMARGMLYDPYFVRHAARALGYDELEWPYVYGQTRSFDPSGMF